MDIEQLTKSQIILLTLLVSFVTSIATGIVTVTLLDQAPATVTGTINKVVERTVERVVPAESNASGTQQAAAVTTKETTIVVKENDLITESIEFNQGRLVRIYTSPESSASTSTTTPANSGRVFRGYGFVARSNGVIATADEVVVPGRIYEFELADGSIHRGEILIEGVDSIGLFQLLKDTEGEGSVERSFPQVTYTDPSALKLGQTVIQISGTEEPRIAIGSVAALPYIQEEIEQSEGEEGEEGSAPKTISVLSEIQTTIPGTTPIGAPLVNMFKEIVGMGTSKGFIPITSARIHLLIEQAKGLEEYEEPAAQ